MLGLAHARRMDWLYLGLSEKDPHLASARRFPHRLYRSQVFRVRYQGQPAAPDRRRTLPGTGMVIKQEVVPVGELPTAQLHLLQQLYEAHYGGLHHFARDLCEKDWVLLLRSGQQVVGFSSLQRRPQPGFVVYFSGDTLVLPGHRHSFNLPRLWGRFVFQRVAHEELPCLWFLICGGFRTYRFLPVFFQRFYPRFDQPTPAESQKLLGSRPAAANLPGTVSFAWPLLP